LLPQKVVALEWQRWIGKETRYVLVIAHIQLYRHPPGFQQRPAPMQRSKIGVKPATAINKAPAVRAAIGINRVVFSVVTHKATVATSSVHQNSMAGV
jgi:hypothetical protein